MDKGKLYFCTKLASMNEWDAPKSNNIIALLSLTRIIPMIPSELLEHLPLPHDSHEHELDSALLE
jgi:hypothetical protein